MHDPCSHETSYLSGDTIRLLYFWHFQEITFDLKTWINILGFVVCFLHSRVMWIFVHMSARSCRGSSFVYLFLACSWFFRFKWCVFLWTCEWGHHCGHSGIHVLTQHFVFSAVAALPHTCSVGHRGCSAQPWPTYLLPRGRPLAWISFRIFDSGVCHFWVKYTILYIDETRYVWIWPLFTQVMVVFRGKLNFFFFLSESRNNRQPDEERARRFWSLSAVWLMNYGWGYRLFSSALLHWPTLNSVQIWSETSWEMLS